MKRKIGSMAILLAALVCPALAHAANISWTLPAAYTNGTPIAPADSSKIVVKVYTGSSETGPWTLAVTTSPGATSTTAPDPGPGQTLWYTTTSTINGVESAYSTPGSKTAPAGPLPAPKAPAAPTTPNAPAPPTGPLPAPKAPAPPTTPKAPAAPTNLRMSLLPLGTGTMGWAG